LHHSSERGALFRLRFAFARSDPLELLAKKIIEIGQTGMRDPVQIGRLALKEIGISKPE
jgi:hypothetical protein